MPNTPLQPGFWDAEDGELWDSLNELLIVTLTDGIADGVEALPEEYRVLADFNRVNQEVLDYARQYRYDWIKKINDTTRQQVQTAMQDWIREGSPLSALAARLAPVFGKVRAEMIAATETTRVYAKGNQQAWESTEVVGAMKIQTAKDEKVCPICGPRDGSEVGIGDTDAMPPFHVNCRCWTRPVVDEGAVARRFSEIFK